MQQTKLGSKARRFDLPRPLKIMAFASAFLLSACASNDGSRSVDNEFPSESTPDSTGALIAEAIASDGSDRAKLSLLAARQIEDSAAYSLTDLQLEDFEFGNLENPILKTEIALLAAQAAVADNDHAHALNRLQSLDVSNLIIPPQLLARYYQQLGDSLRGLGQTNAALDAYISASEADQLSRELSDSIWELLQNQSDTELGSLASSSASYAARGWIELARVSRSEQLSIRGQLDAINQWQRIWAQHPAVNRLPSPLQELSAIWDNRPRHIALLLPVQQPAGLAIQEGFLGAYYQALQISRDVPSISIYDSGDINGIESLYRQAVDNGAELVIGPLNKEYVNRLHAMNELPVPTLALNYADATGPGPENLFQFGLAPEDEITQAVLAAWQQGHRNAALLTPAGASYERLQTVFTDTWNELGGRLVSRSTFTGDSNFTSVIKRLMAIDSSEARAERLLQILPRNNMEFTPRRRSDIDFIFLMANPRQGRQIKPTLAFYFAEDVPVYSMPSIYDGLNNISANQDLDGIMFTVEPWLLSDDELKSGFADSLRPVQGPLQRLRALGIDSYRLYARLQQLDSGQLQSLRGATGILSLNPARRLQRQLQMARFEQGQAVAIPVTESSPGE
jgi:outer membrane PBP1 activator LpoA protein